MGVVGDGGELAGVAGVGLVDSDVGNGVLSP